MTRLRPATPAIGAARAILGTTAAVVLALAASGCASGSPVASPTPDPFVGLAERSDQAFREGLEAYGQGRYRDALAAFDRARLLSPTQEPRIDQMLERTRAALAPTATAVPPAATDTPATPTAVPVVPSAIQPQADLGRRYFGRVVMSAVSDHDAAPTPARQFFFQDQIGLSIEGLKQHQRLPLSLRVFNMDSDRLIAEVRSDDASASSARTAPREAPVPTTRGGTDETAIASGSLTPAPQPELTRFFDSYIWYHQGGEAPGRYRAELYANGTLTHTFDYTVGTVPLPTPEAAPNPALDPTPGLLVEPAPPTPAPVVEASPAVPAPVVPPTPTPQPTLPPTPTPVPTPANAYTTLVGGVPAGLDVDPATGRFFVADASGVVWSTDASAGVQRATLGTPLKLPRSVAPVDLAADPIQGRIYVAARASATQPQPCPGQVSADAWPGCVVVLTAPAGSTPPALVSSIPLVSRPGDLRLDAERGLLYVVLPDQRAIGVIDVRASKLVQVIDELPQVTSMALDSARHTLYAAHLTGQLTMIDTNSQQITGRASLTGAGLSGVATARGLAYGINTATHELAVVEPMSRGVIRYPLSQEPAAITASEDSGTVFVLSSRSNVILRVDPLDGTEVGRVLLANRSGVSANRPADLQSLRPRFVLDVANETVFATLPELGTLAAVTVDSFPVLARPIPWVELPDEPRVASIPPVLRPGSGTQPSDSDSLRAQPSTNADEDGI